MYRERYVLFTQLQCYIISPNLYSFYVLIDRTIVTVIIARKKKKHEKNESFVTSNCKYVFSENMGVKYRMC